MSIGDRQGHSSSKVAISGGVVVWVRQGVAAGQVCLLISHFCILAASNDYQRD